ncbi:MAG: M15 family metallopeptidase [Oscillospiraceae bacterium]|nr:M15 family metallopeptidase [Oscillospiraceae bacterium]
MSCLKQKTPDYLILINEDNRLPENFVDTVELISVRNSEGTEYVIEKKTYEAFMRLREDILKNDGLQAELISVYRTVAQQEKTFNGYVDKFGIEYARKYAAIPGHSEHHTGFAIDVSFVVEGRLPRLIKELLEMDDLFKIVHKKLAKYGFILRYPSGKEDITKIGYEPWHFRYIDSLENAGEIAEADICFEEYWEKKLNG